MGKFAHDYWQPHSSLSSILANANKESVQVWKMIVKLQNIHAMTLDFSILLKTNRLQNDLFAEFQDHLRKQEKLIFGNESPARVWPDFCIPALFAINELSLFTSNNRMRLDNLKVIAEASNSYFSSTRATDTATNWPNLSRPADQKLSANLFTTENIEEAFAVIQPSYRHGSDDDHLPCFTSANPT